MSEIIQIIALFYFSGITSYNLSSYLWHGIKSLWGA